MNTLETAFHKWIFDRGFNPDAELTEAFNAGYLAGFDHAKNEAITALDNALGKKVNDD